MLFPVTGMLVDAIGASVSAEKRGGPCSAAHLWNDALRVALVAGLAWLAASQVHALDHIVALAGCLASTPLSLVVPPLLHLKLVPNLSRWSALVDVFSVTVGMLVTVVTTVLTFATWGDAAS